METKTTPVHPLLVGTTPGPWLQGCRVTGHGIGIHVTTISAGLVASVGDNDARCAGLHKMYASQHYDNDSTRLAVLEANAKLIAAAPSLAAENAALADQVDRLRDRLELLTTAAENVEPQITRGGLEEEDAFIVARQQARRLLSSLKSDNP